MEKFFMTNSFIGAIKKLYFIFLQRCFKFDPWHITPINFRPYAQQIVKYINEECIVKENDIVVEIGCGLGEILHYIKSTQRKGYDISKEAISAARLLDRKIKFKRGTFTEVSEKKVDVLITVNFIHGIDGDSLKRYYECLIRKCQPKYIVVDEVRSKEYQYNHKFEEIIPDYYDMVKKTKRFQAFKGHRFVYFFKNSSRKVD